MYRSTLTFKVFVFIWTNSFVSSIFCYFHKYLLHQNYPHLNPYLILSLPILPPFLHFFDFSVSVPIFLSFICYLLINLCTGTLLISVIINSSTIHFNFLCLPNLSSFTFYLFILFLRNLQFLYKDNPVY